MAGHSKWAQIKRHKAIVDQKKGSTYAQYAKLITIACKLYGVDPGFNFRLRDLIVKAKACGMPADRIRAAIDRAADGRRGGILEEVLYEGYGPYGVAILMLVATDNRNRTASELRLALGRAGGNLGESGCVSWNFTHCGLLIAKLGQLSCEELLTMLDAQDVLDFEENLDDGLLTIVVKPECLAEASKILSESDALDSSELTYIPKDVICLAQQEHMAHIEEIKSILEDQEDVQNVFHNAVI